MIINKALIYSVFHFFVSMNYIKLGFLFNGNYFIKKDNDP
jgi:hypothetical protein